MPRRSPSLSGQVGRSEDGIVFLNRRARAGRWLAWKVRIFSVAAVLGLAGIAFEERWLTGAAIVLLFAGMGLRFLPGDHEPEDEGEEDTGDA